jgi:hypothetical protein
MASGYWNTTREVLARMTVVEASYVPAFIVARICIDFSRICDIAITERHT